MAMFTAYFDRLVVLRDGSPFESIPSSRVSLEVYVEIGQAVVLVVVVTDLVDQHLLVLALLSLRLIESVLQLFLVNFDVEQILEVLLRRCFGVA